MQNKTNWLAIVVAVVAAMGIGFLWYGAIFQNQWMAGNGIVVEGTKYLKNGVEMDQSPMPMVFNTVAMVAYALILNWFLGRMGVTTWMGGAQVGAVIGAVMVLGIITGNLFAQRPSSLSMVDGSYSFVLFTIMGAIIGGWPKKS